MRADRLLSILMLLQSRGHMTARALAGELEVSERTIYRDLDALSAAGVPVYAERGPGGGCALLDNYRTTLTGLTGDEVQALFMLSIPAPLAELGVSRELRAALLKLAGALPAARRAEEERARRRIHLDSVAWLESREPVPHLRTLHQALWQERRVRITYELPFDARAHWLVDPYGLVAKANTWYLVCARQGQVRVCQVSQVLEAEPRPESFDYPDDFDLAAFWQGWCAEIEKNHPRYPVTARVVATALPALLRFLAPEAGSGTLGPQPLTPALPLPGGDGRAWTTVSLCFESLDEARRRFLGLGGAAEVLAPQALRDSVRDHAIQTLAVYG